MRKSGFAFALIGLAVMPAHADNAQALMQRNYDATRVGASSFQAEIELKSSSGQTRVMRTENSTRLEGESNSRLTRFLLPTDVRATATLLVERLSKDDDMWIYLPALKKVRRLVASNKRDSFVGTDFTFGDILSHKVQDWEHRSTGESRVGDQPCTLIESVPRSDAIRSQTGYAKRVSCISVVSGVALRTDYWDEYSKPLKWVTATEIKQVDQSGHWQPMLLQAGNLQSGHQTVIRFTNFKVEHSLSADLFKPRELERDF